MYKYIEWEKNIQNENGPACSGAVNIDKNPEHTKTTAERTHTVISECRQQ